jgi:hypothetical protein
MLMMGDNAKPIQAVLILECGQKIVRDMLAEDQPQEQQDIGMQQLLELIWRYWKCN